MSDSEPTSPHAGTRDHYHHGALKDVLVKEAFAVLEERGIEELSLRELAERVGVSKNAPYRHFASKKDLLTVLAVDGFGEFADAMEAAALQGASKAPRQDELSRSLNALREMFRAYLEFARRRPACYRLMFSPLGYSLHSESCKSSSMRAFGKLSEVIRQAHDAGWRPDEEPIPKGLQIWATLHGWSGIINDHLLPEHLVQAANFPLEDLLFGRLNY